MQVISFHMERHTCLHNLFGNLCWKQNLVTNWMGGRGGLWMERCKVDPSLTYLEGVELSFTKVEALGEG